MKGIIFTDKVHSLFTTHHSLKLAAFTLAEGATYVAHWNNSRKIAFTLAEVLITLGIIGVVAAITMPTLINNYQKKAARIATILTNIYEKDLARILNEGGVKFNKTIKRGKKEVKAPVSSYLFDLPLELSNKEREERKKNGKPFISLTELAEKTKRKLDPISPRT